MFFRGQKTPQNLLLRLMGAVTLLNIMNMSSLLLAVDKYVSSHSNSFINADLNFYTCELVTTSSLL